MVSCTTFTKPGRDGEGVSVCHIRCPAPGDRPSCYCIGQGSIFLTEKEKTVEVWGIFRTHRQTCSRVGVCTPLGEKAFSSVLQLVSIDLWPRDAVARSWSF